MSHLLRSNAQMYQFFDLVSFSLYANDDQNLQIYCIFYSWATVIEKSWPGHYFNIDF
jgi:hypothetical protein